LIFSFLQKNAKGGETARDNYIADSTEADVVIMGSSRALHHYNPSIIEDSINMTCYNCGNDANGILLMYGRYLMMINRYRPKVILYDINVDADYYYDGDRFRFLKPLISFYDRKGIDSIFFKVDKYSKVKMFSYLYRYNTSFTSVIRDYIKPKTFFEKGYLPKDLKIKYEPKRSAFVKKKIDSIKQYYFLHFIEKCKINKTKLIFIISPYYNGDDKKYMEIIDLAKKYRIPLLNYSGDNRFRYHKDLFYDGIHLNRKGSCKYTKIIIKDLKPLIN
jgi:hypothetical protein